MSWLTTQLTASGVEWTVAYEIGRKNPSDQRGFLMPKTALVGIVAGERIPFVVRMATLVSPYLGRYHAPKPGPASGFGGADLR